MKVDMKRNGGQEFLSTLGRERKSENYTDHYFKSDMVTSVLKTVPRKTRLKSMSNPFRLL